MARAALSTLATPEAEALAHGRHGDPFKVLGPRDSSAGRVVVPISGVSVPADRGTTTMVASLASLGTSTGGGAATASRIASMKSAAEA